MFKEFWDGLAPSGRRGLAVGVVAILALTAAFAYWTMRADYDVLFGNLSARDAASMTEELDRMKLPYRLGADGTSILVDKVAVPATRLKLMSKDIPLHGAVGFELFNNADFGMTEFAQKINYQRALQGELTRTILSLQEIESARVHIAFPEDGLFKHDQSKAKASVTLAMKPSETLRLEQVAGIQRLVAASVTGISADDVTIVNEHGVALTRAAIDGDSSSAAATDLKHDIEQALVRKATLMLDKTVGAGHAVVSVDATLDMDQVRVTKEDVTHPPAAAGDQPAGVVVRQRETIKDDNGAASTQRESAGGNSQRETEYQVGRRVEQVVSQPGSIRRLQVVAVVQGGLSQTQQDQIRTVLGAAVGASADRGDQVVVQSVDLVAAPAAKALAAAGESPVAPPSADALRVAAPVPTSNRLFVILPLLMLVVLLALALLLLRRPGTRRATPTRVEPMTDAQREAALLRLRLWLAADERPAAAAPGARDAA